MDKNDLPFDVIPYSSSFLGECLAVWNEVVRDGNAFPQEEELSLDTGDAFFSGQTFTGLARSRKTGRIAGLYILHPNNVGRCGHICNASYAVAKEWRGHHLGGMLVSHSLQQGKRCGFRIGMLASGIQRYAVRVVRRGEHKTVLLPMRNVGDDAGDADLAAFRGLFAGQWAE